MPYAEQKRRVIFQAAPPDPVLVKPRNTIVQWETPHVEITKEFKYLGVVKANPHEYVQTYGASLKTTTQLPAFVHEIRKPDGVVLAAEQPPHAHPHVHELEGDLHALKLVDLEHEGLGEYVSYLRQLGLYDHEQQQQQQQQREEEHALTVESSADSFDDDALNELITQIFHTIDRHGRGRITVEDAEKTLLRLNSRLGRNYGENDVRAFFGALDANNDGTLELSEFKRAFLSITA